LIVSDSTKPVLVLPPNINFTCFEWGGNPKLGNATATDNCDPNPVLYFNVTEIRTKSNQILYKRVWTAIDYCGNQISADQNVYITDTEAPELSIPEDYFLDCKNKATGPAVTGNATASDCSNDTVLTYDDTTSSTSTSFIIYRLWSATDGTNVASKVQRIFISDKQAPNITIPADTSVLQCTADISFEALGRATATDNCDPSPNITYIDSPRGICSYTIERTWTAEDSSGNRVSKTQLISLEDTNPPSFIDNSKSKIPPFVTIDQCIPLVPVTIKFNIAGEITNDMLHDNCSNIGDITYYDNITKMKGADGCITGTFTRDWYVSDECDNTFSFHQEFIISYTKDSPATKIVCSIFLIMLSIFGRLLFNK
jgi:hypothetical protein